MAAYNDKCPVCEGPISITGFTVKNCDIPIRPNGWAVMATHKNTDGSEWFTCHKCQVSVPAMFVYKEMSLKEAQGLMRRWSGNVLSIHNRMPLPKDGTLPPMPEDEPEEVEAKT